MVLIYMGSHESYDLQNNQICMVMKHHSGERTHLKIHTGLKWIQIVKDIRVLTGFYIQRMEKVSSSVPQKERAR